MTKSKILRQLIEQKGAHIAPTIYDCIGAIAAQKTGFQYAFSSGFGISASQLGKPDYGYLTATQIIATINRLSSCSELAIIADIDTGYGNPLNVIDTVEKIIKAGAAGIILEDQEWPKRCGHFEGKAVISKAEHIEKIKAAKFAAKDSGLVLVARSDSRSTFGLAEAINRAEGYLSAGADVLFIEAPESKQELIEIANYFKGVPLMANIIKGGKTPNLTAQELEDMGYKLIVFALSNLLATTKTMLDTMAAIKTGSNTDINNDFAFGDFQDFIGISKYKKLEKKYISSK
ncbi:MAG TPA: isocitrate lyase/PEP mutase family protein [Trueperaceae bacterium]|nr:isocitrate lyase/PEP mutase family protein [Trueperaceae bacterium]